MLQLYMDLASSRLARQAIQRIQRIQCTRYTAHSTKHPPSGNPTEEAAKKELEEAGGVCAMK